MSRTPNAAILVVDDEAPMRRMLRLELGDLGYQVGEAADLDSALAELDRRPYELVLTDLALGETRLEGMEVLAKTLEVQPGVPVVIITARASIEQAVAAIKSGAFHFIAKPFDPNDLAVVVRAAVEWGRQARELEAMRRDRARLVAGMVGESPAMQELARMIHHVAATDTTVLIQGESGTGKELVARSLHAGSPRAERPFVAVDCGALEANLLASELFGHVKGAFTGADTTRQGLFQAAHLGTLFLDEIGNLPLDLQARLLRVLQERRVRPLGGNTQRELDVRVVAATNRALGEMAAEGRFRQDLYYRLAVVTLKVPPLRERRDDVPLLVGHFARVAAARLGRREPTFLPPVMERLASYGWPGNIRELANVIERAVITAGSGPVREVDLPQLRSGDTPFGEPLDVAVARAEREAIVRALGQCHGSKTEAARVLRISRRALYDKLARHGIASDDE